jgi:predicted DNA binding CopG/RHH family protein
MATQVLHTRVPPDDAHAIREAAAARGTTVATLLRELVTGYVAEHNFHRESACP